MTAMAGCLPDPLRFATYDVFTEQRFSGNPLAIVENADGLSTAQMQTIAREFNLSETIFVQSPDDPAHDAKVRIFFPTAEIPFAGHPTIGCAIHLALKSAPKVDFETAITLEEVAGLVPVRVSRIGERLQAEFRAPVLPHPPEHGALPDVGELAAAVGLDPATIGTGAHGPGLWQGGPSYLYLPVRDLASLATARPSEPAWSRAMEIAEADSIYLYAPLPQGEGADFRARMFSPTAGIPEDPATGSAAAIMAAQLHAAGGLSEGETRLTLHQGVEMGRASTICLRIAIRDGTLSEVHVSGSAVPVSHGWIDCPD
ncbi:PhzF family phenazine biosynthesis protein [Roseovarius sp. A-2]|uniref:PhzF family phenazine biosynthesis protein n=1 Tax=Roseovarius sp. A-2 TaxID=1570360 RepID=UPI0020CB4330|nr:PhzF family phenazine biosynthesis protein [Roseovarius sp. A-2]